MNKLIAALIAGLFAVSVNAFAADAAAPKANAKPVAETTAPAAGTAMEKPAAPASKKVAHKAHHKMTAHKKIATTTPAAAAPAATIK